MKLKALFCTLVAGVAFQAVAGPVTPKPMVIHRPSAEEMAAARNLQLLYPAVQSSVTAYFNSHGMKRDAVREGLVIPWTVTKPVEYVGQDFWGNTQTMEWRGATDYVHGYAVALGRSQGGCPLFKIKGVDENDIRYNRGPGTPLDFPPATAICP